MNIYISSGIGYGQTKLAAFDAALNQACIANFNLIKLSSIIPPKSMIFEPAAEEIPNTLTGGWGDRLYVVIAERREDTTGNDAWAGIGWVQDKKSGRGLFVEHEGSSRRDVEKDIESSLQDLMKTRKIDFSPINMKVVGATCKTGSVCSLVCAVYQASDWNNKPLVSGELGPCQT